MFSCIHWELITTLLSKIPADMRNQIPFGWECGSKHSHLLGFLWHRDTPCQMWTAAKLSTVLFRGGGGYDQQDFYVMQHSGCKIIRVKRISYQINLKVDAYYDPPTETTHTIHINPGSPLWSVERHPLQIYMTWNTSHRKSTKNGIQHTACAEMKSQFK